jgi:photoactive yellow protein
MTSPPLHPSGQAALQVVCAWCGSVIRAGDQPVSHGICPACIAVELPAGALQLVPESDLDRLPFGVIRLTGDGVIRSYNRTESERARRAPAAVIGRNFFTEVAPCTNVQQFQGRLRRMRERGQPSFERFSFLFRLPWAAQTVSLGLSYDPATDSAVLTVTWPPDAVHRSA